MTAPVLAVRRRDTGVLEGCAGGVPGQSEAALLLSQAAQWHCRLPKSAHPGAPAAIKDIYNTDDIDHTQTAIKAFETDYDAKYPKAVAKITGGADVLLGFYKYPGRAPRLTRSITRAPAPTPNLASVRAK
jgi:hypothetical protein